MEYNIIQNFPLPAKNPLFYTGIPQREELDCEGERESLEKRDGSKERKAFTPKNIIGITLCHKDLVNLIIASDGEYIIKSHG